MLGRNARPHPTSAEDIHAKTMKDISIEGHENDENFDAFDLRSENPDENSRCYRRRTIRCLTH